MDEKYKVFLIVKYGSLHNAYAEWVRNRWNRTSTALDDKYMREWVKDNQIYFNENWTSSAAKQLAEQIDKDILESIIGPCT